MGYNTSPALIEDNIVLLKSILAALERGEAFKIAVSQEDNISSMQYKVRRILAATDYHPNTFGGMFAGLGSRTSVRVEHAKGRLSIEPRRGAKGTLTLAFTPITRSEFDAIEELHEYEGSMTTIKFNPSSTFNESTLAISLDKLGWKLYPTTRMKDDEGLLSYVVEKKKEILGFDILDHAPEG